MWVIEKASVDQPDHLCCLMKVLMSVLLGLLLDVTGDVYLPYFGGVIVALNLIMAPAGGTPMQWLS